MRRRAHGILLLHHRPSPPWTQGRADNVAQNLAAFRRHSRFPVWTLNTDHGFPPESALPPGIDQIDFDAIVLHYSVFVPNPDGYLLGEDVLDYLAGSDAYKVAFFQDEHHWCRMREDFIDAYGIDCVYTLLEPRYAAQVYGERTRASRLVSHLPSYVSAELTRAAARFGKRARRRSIDIGYRGRLIPAYMGRGGQEKREIGLRFAALAAGSGLVLDIAVGEEDRMYGAEWSRFTADCKGTLGTESGVSCFDLEDEVRADYERLSRDGHEPTLDELERGALGRWDGRIPYRTISPRNFEAAAFRVCQVLFEGDYSGAMQPMRHYIPLRKDFSNLDEVIERFKDEALRRELIDNTHRDLIESGEYSYQRLIAGFDEVLIDAGLRPEPSRLEARRVSRTVRRPLRERLQRYRETRWAWLQMNRPKLVHWIRMTRFYLEFPRRMAGRLRSAGRRLLRPRS